MKTCIIKFTTIAAAAVLMTGCATKQQTGALVGGVIGAAVAGPIGGSTAAHVGAAIVGSVVGAFIGGEIGKRMDERDHRMVRESVETTSTKTWKSTSGTSYSATTTSIDADHREVTVTDGTYTEKAMVVKKNNQWVRE